jgi:REP-associated tyrosine transposase
MADNLSIHPHVGRKTPAKGVHYSSTSNNITWVTVCTTDREPWLTQQIVREHLESLWLHEATAWLVSDYLLMPDHIHFICAPRNLNVTIEK